MSNGTSEKTGILPRYTPETFINREEEIKFVTEKAELLAQGIELDERTVVFMGQRGTGKSWLMCHLHNIIKEAKLNTISQLIDLKDFTDFSHEETVNKILHQLAQTLDYPLSANVDLSELSREFMQNLRSAVKNRSLVLLIDTVFESDWGLLAMLENSLFGPLAIERKVLIILAGRGHAYPWKTPELRLRAKFCDLDGFNPDNTKIQLEKQKLEGALQVDRIYALSRGNPLANFVLGVQPDELFTALDQTINELLEVVPSDAQERMRQNLEALCVLNAFDEEQIPDMLAAYHGDSSYCEMKPAQARKVREDIVKWGFAYWDEKEKGYVIDSTLLNLVQYYLKEGQQQKWQALNCAAYSLYETWMEKYKRTRERWQREADYHVSQLKELGYSLEDCSRFEN